MRTPMTPPTPARRDAATGEGTMNRAEWDAMQARESRLSVIHAAERIRAAHDPADWPSLHHGPITYERASQILEWWWSREVLASGFSSLELHMPKGVSL